MLDLSVPPLYLPSPNRDTQVSPWLQLPVKALMMTWLGLIFGELLGGQCFLQSLVLTQALPLYWPLPSQCGCYRRATTGPSTHADMSGDLFLHPACSPLALVRILRDLSQFLTLLGAYACYALPVPHITPNTHVFFFLVGQNSAVVGSFFLWGSCSNPFHSWGSVGQDWPSKSNLQTPISQNAMVCCTSDHSSVNTEKSHV